MTDVIYILGGFMVYGGTFALAPKNWSFWQQVTCAVCVQLGVTLIAMGTRR
jgi:hypothetical protein